MERQLKMRVLIAKPGLGGHDRRAKQIAQGLKEQGFEVVFTGLRQTPGQIADAALSHQVDAVALSLPDSAQADLAAQVKALLHSQGAMDVVLLGFGDIPAVCADRHLLNEEGVRLLDARLPAIYILKCKQEDRLWNSNVLTMLASP